MYTLQPDAEAFAEAARHFCDILIDASSIIVLADIGALERAAQIWRLATIPEAALEAGPDLLTKEEHPITIRQVSPIQTERLQGKPSTDLLLVETAKKHRWPLLSEDRKILMAAEDAGLHCFDSLVAIELLKALSSQEPALYEGWHRRILSRNKYSSYRRSWADQIAMALMKLM